MSAASQNASYQSLYRSCMKEAASRGHTLMQRLVSRCIKSMAQRATEMHDAQERHLLTEAARILMKHQEALCEAYPQALLGEFAQAIAGANARASALSFDSLELMGEEQLQEGVEVVRTQQAVLNAVEAELAELSALICAVQGLRTVQSERNPLRPEVYVRSLRTVTMQSPIPPSVRTRWMQYLGDALGPELAQVYRELSQMLRSQGVEAAGYDVTPGREVAAVRPAGSAPAGGPASTLLNVRELRRLLSGQFDQGDDSFAAQFAREFESGDRTPMPAEFSVTVPAAYEALQEMKQVDQVMQRLKQRASAPPVTLTGLAAERELMRQQATGPGQALGLEVVSLMVENIGNDGRLLAPVQQAVRDLEPALLRLVVDDPRFFSDKGHPARRLLEQMTQRSLAWASVDSPGFAAFYEPLQQAVDALLGTRVSGPEPFEFALASLEEAWGDLQKRDRRYREKAVRALLHAEQRNLLAGKVSRQLRARPDVAAADRDLCQFIIGPWSQVVAQARVADPAGSAGSADPGGHIGLLSDLLWSAQPQLARGNPERLARLAPQLLDKLRSGLASIDYPSAETERFVEYLFGLHQQAIAGAPVLPTPMTRADLDTWFAQDGGGDRSPWLAPGEAQQSGFMETHLGSPAQPLYQSTQPGSSVAPETDSLDAVPTLGAAGLQPGAWVEMLMQERWQRLHLTWASPHGTLFMFTDAAGKSHSMTRRLLDQLVAAQGLRLISDQAVVEVALDAVAQAAVNNSPELRH